MLCFYILSMIIDGIYAAYLATWEITNLFYLTLYGPNSFFIVFRDIALDSLFSSTDSYARRSKEFFFLKKWNRIEISVKGDINVLLGVKGLMKKLFYNFISYKPSIIQQSIESFFKAQIWAIDPRQGSESLNPSSPPAPCPTPSDIGPNASFHVCVCECV